MKRENPIVSEKRAYRRKISAQLDDWIQRFHDLDFIVKPEADQKQWVSIPQTLRIAFFPKNEYTESKYSLSDILSIALADYQQARTRYLMVTNEEYYESHILDYANGALMVIQDLLARGLIEQKEGSAHKLRLCDEQKTETERKLREAHQEIERLRNLVRVLHGDPDTTGNTFTGDVDNGKDE